MQGVTPLRRWLYRGQRPHAAARLANRLQTRLALMGVGPEWLCVLEVPGWRTGRRARTPVVIADHGGERYLVSMLGERANWVRSVRANDGRAVLRHRGMRAVELVEVDVADRAPILRSYLRRATGARSHFSVSPDATSEEFAAVAALYPVFRIASSVAARRRRHRGSTPPIAGARAIAELATVDLNGQRQWVLIRGNDVANPLLLLLHGGPGDSNMWLAHHSTRELEHHFVCVHWEQRGTGKSLDPRPDLRTMTVAQFVADTITLIELLRARFHQQKVLLLGHSWGSLLAMRVAAERPDLLHAVIGMGQHVDARRAEEISYRWVLDRARATGNSRAVRQLERLGHSDTYDQNPRFKERLWLLRFGGMVHSGSLLSWVGILLRAPEYTLRDRIRFLRMSSLKFSIPPLAGEILASDMLRDVPEVSVPVVLFEGRHDFNNPSSLAEEYFAALRAPAKDLVWFEQSAHTPDLDEPRRFQEAVIAVGRRFCRPSALAVSLPPPPPALRAT